MDGDRIVLQGMEFHGYHGVFAEEARLGARFTVDVELHAPLPGDDDLAATVDYSRVYATVEALVTETRFRLIEALANAIADRLLAQEPRLRRVVVRVHKPHAPLPGVVGDVYVQVERGRSG